MYTSLKRLDEDNYRALADAIILQAVKDYRWALKMLNRNHNNTMANTEKREIESFFKSSWFTHLTNVDGIMLMNRIKQEVNG